MSHFEQILTSAAARSSTGQTRGVVIPLPRCPVTTRVATVKDLPFLDALQKMHTHMVGWFPRQQMQAYVENGHVLVAESAGVSECGSVGVDAHADTPSHRNADTRTPLGYCIAKDQYAGREDVGI